MARKRRRRSRRRCMMLEVVLDVCPVQKKVGWAYGRLITARARWAFGQAKQQTIRGNVTYLIPSGH
jgi:hypothetical protein